MSNNTEQAEDTSPGAHWRFLFETLRQRLISPWCHPLFTIYFLIVLVLFGGMGVWVPLYQNHGRTVSDAEALSVPYGIATYLIAIITSAIADIVLTSDERASFRLFVSGVGAIAIILGIVSLISNSLKLAYYLSMLGAVMSLALWCIVNGDNQRLREPPPPTASTGGDPEQSLAGDLDGLDA